jgi:hypothetical protein
MSSQKFASLRIRQVSWRGMREHITGIGVVDVMRITLAAAIGCY